MKHNMIWLTVILALLLGLCSGCGLTGSAKSDRYNEILALDHISVSQAYDQLKDEELTDPGQQLFVQQLFDLTQCSGAFVQTSAETGNRYGAEVSFYLTGGTVNCAIEYDGFMGTIADGTVTPTQAEGYLFEASPKGDLYGREMDFTIYFSTDRLRILWGDTCDETLTRGDGSADSVTSYKVPFDQTSTYDLLVSTLDEQFADFAHAIVYDEAGMTLNVYFQAPDQTRAALTLGEPDLVSAWAEVSTNFCELSNNLLTVVKVSGDCLYVNIYFVDTLNSANHYDKTDWLLWVQNGVEQYNYATDG